MGLPAPAERAARVPPRTTPLMVFDERRFVPILVVATREPKAFVESKALVMFDMAKPEVVVAEVEVAPPYIVNPPPCVPFPIVELAATMTPIVEVGAMYEVVGSFQALPKLRPSV